MTFLNPNYDPYPGVGPTGSSSQSGITYGGSMSDDGLPGANDNPGNWLGNTIGPDYADYPLPLVAEAKPSSAAPDASAPNGVAVAPTAASQPSADAQPSTAQLTGSVAAADAMPVLKTLQRAYCFNPAFHGEREARKRAADEHVTIDAQPVTFAVPAGCNAVDLWFGPVEPAPGSRPHDFQHVIQMGKARVVDAEAGGELDDARLCGGQLVAIIVPWRVAATAQIEGGRLRMAVMAHFYAITPPGVPRNA